jgi:hypothetical protein
MIDLQLQKKNIRIHQDFWMKRNSVPVVSYRRGDFFFSRHFKAAADLLVPGRIITPEILDVSEFLSDYERMYQESLETEQSGFWSGEPYTGIPWMEAILGCRITAGESSFTSEPLPTDKSLEASFVLDQNNPWLLKYLEFTRELVTLSDGRFPVGQPIMRGPTDMTGALLGQSELIFHLFDNPLEMKELILSVTGVFIEVMRLQNQLIPTWNGGSSIGFYHLWAPGDVIWFQDDLSSVLSPELYREFYLSAARRIASRASFNLMHLHPSSFFILEDLLQIEEIKVIEVNKDIGGSELNEMMPELQKILRVKNLVFWGDLTLEDLKEIKRNLPSQGLHLNIVKSSPEEIKEISEYIRHWN